MSFRWRVGVVNEVVYVNVNEAAVSRACMRCMTDEASPRFSEARQTAPPRSAAAVTGSNQDSTQPQIL